MMLLDMALVLLVGFAIGWLACFWQHKRQDDDLLRQMSRWRESSGGWVHSVPGNRIEPPKKRQGGNDPSMRATDERQATDRQVRRNAEVRQ